MTTLQQMNSCNDKHQSSTYRTGTNNAQHYVHAENKMRVLLPPVGTMKPIKDCSVNFNGAVAFLNSLAPPSMLDTYSSWFIKPLALLLLFHPVIACSVYSRKHTALICVTKAGTLKYYAHVSMENRTYNRKATNSSIANMVSFGKRYKACRVLSKLWRPPLWEVLIWRYLVHACAHVVHWWDPCIYRSAAALLYYRYKLA